jgi:hypothetical protein
LPAHDGERSSVGRKAGRAIRDICGIIDRSQPGAVVTRWIPVGLSVASMAGCVTLAGPASRNGIPTISRGVQCACLAGDRSDAHEQLSNVVVPGL